VWLDVRDAPHEYVYNVPVTLAPVFPGEQVGLGSRPELLEVARRTARTVRLEGGNDLVWQPLVRARLGILDLDWSCGRARIFWSASCWRRTGDCATFWRAMPWT
jgi:hypothetical protein